MNELAVDREAQELGVAVAELAPEIVESDDLRRADEGEILGPGEEHEPFSGIALVGRRREGRARIGAGHGREREGRKLVADGQHCWFSLRGLSRREYGAICVIDKTNYFRRHD